jgi:hypothetical protein
VAVVCALDAFEIKAKQIIKRKMDLSIVNYNAEITVCFLDCLVLLHVLLKRVEGFEKGFR